MSEKQKIVKTTHGPDTRAIIDGLLLLGKMEILTYAQMSDLIGKPVAGDSSEYQMARKILARDYGVEIKTIKKVGGQRLDDGGIVDELPRDRQSIHRKVKRSLRRAGNVEDYNSLSNSQRLEHSRHVAQLGIMRELHRPAVQRAIDDRVTQGLSQIDVQKLIEVLRK